MDYYSFLFYPSEKYLQFRKKQQHLSRLFFKLCISKVMYITLKRIEKIMFLSILRILLICKFLICQLSVKVIYKQTVKNNDYWIFLISFTFTFVFFLELDTIERRIVQRIYLRIWVKARHELTTIETRTHSINLCFCKFLITFLIDKWSFPIDA